MDFVSEMVSKLFCKNSFIVSLPNGLNINKKVGCLIKTISRESCTKKSILGNSSTIAISLFCFAFFTRIGFSYPRALIWDLGASF